jgi:hypothetical protein
VSEAVSLDPIGRTLLAIQAEMRTVRDENTLIRHNLGRMARRDQLGPMVQRDELLDVLRVLSDRIGSFEATMLARLDQTERSLHERLTHLEALLPPKP